VRGASSTVVWALFQACFLASMILMAISCIVVTATSCDALSVLLLGNAWGLQLRPHFGWVSSCPAAGTCAGQAAFAAVAAENGTLLSMGYVVTVALTAPLALVDVSESFQSASYFISLLCLVWLIVKFGIMAAQTHEGDPSEHVLPPPLQWNAGLALEVSFWSWTISFAVPMWLDEKDVSAPLAAPLIAAFSHRAALDLLLGYAGAAAFPRMPATMLNVLQAVGEHPSCGRGTQAAGIIFVISSLATNIVDYAMVAVRNLECHTGAGAANFAGVFLPFATGFLFYFGSTFAELVSIASPLLNGAVQFCVPALLFWSFSFYEKAPQLDMLGLKASTSTWRNIALASAIVTGALIAITYAATASATAAPTSDYAAGDYAPHSRRMG
jgi:hypothetical protein